ncbi:MAG: DUF309 domain-containing protein [Caldilineaceae bacterium]|nr:DUF309 domain-containing protein [Caldilineaceae bacterium]
MEAFNQGDYFDQHEFFEEAWMAEARPIRQMYQGVLQVGVAFLHIQRNNWPGAVKMFRSGLPKLRDLPPVCQHVDIERLRSEAMQIYTEIVALGPERLQEFDQGRFPKLHLLPR